jgi:hypothetical protein
VSTEVFDKKRKFQDLGQVHQARHNGFYETRDGRLGFASAQGDFKEAAALHRYQSIDIC